ncbi:MAG: helix-turn-helix domain-containing protein [Actinomycetota bacterium]|nr:helix-turn-helix domain-containing protein [Actinomycetota bacterium]
MTSIPVSRIGDYIREQRESSKLSLRRLAQESGISNPYLSQIERGLRKPSAEILQQIAKALRISAEQLYVQAGLLEDRDTSLAVETAVLADPVLSERQKRVLLDIYASFMAEAVVGDSASAPAAAPRKRTSPAGTPKTAAAKASARPAPTTRPKRAPKTSAAR